MLGCRTREKVCRALADIQQEQHGIFKAVVSAPVRGQQRLDLILPLSQGGAASIIFSALNSPIHEHVHQPVHSGLRAPVLFFQFLRLTAQEIPLSPVRLAHVVNNGLHDVLRHPKAVEGFLDLGENLVLPDIHRLFWVLGVCASQVCPLAGAARLVTLLFVQRRNGLSGHGAFYQPPENEFFLAPLERLFMPAFHDGLTLVE